MSPLVALNATVKMSETPAQKFCTEFIIGPLCVALRKEELPSVPAHSDSKLGSEGAEWEGTGEAEEGREKRGAGWGGGTAEQQCSQERGLGRSHPHAGGTQGSTALQRVPEFWQGLLSAPGFPGFLSGCWM